MHKNKKITREERTENNRKMIEHKQHGEGLFLFKNKSSFASLDLPKKSFDGKKWVGPNETWKGDNYFFTMIPKDAILIETLIDPNQTIKENNMSEEKLLLDQPDQITDNGQVEHVVSNAQVSINEDKKEEQTEIKDKLLTEDPLAGVTIICD
jgi:hypothetical protein